MSRIAARLEDQWIYSTTAFLFSGSKEYLQLWRSAYCSAKLNSSDLSSLENRINNLVFNLLVVGKAEEALKSMNKTAYNNTKSFIKFAEGQFVGFTLKTAACGVASVFGADPVFAKYVASYTLKPIVDSGLKSGAGERAETGAGYMSSAANFFGFGKITKYAALVQGDLYANSLLNKVDFKTVNSDFTKVLNESKISKIDSYSINPLKVGLLNSLLNIVIKISLLVPYILGKIDGWVCYYYDGSDFIEDAINQNLEKEEQYFFDKMEEYLSVADVTKVRYQNTVASPVNKAKDFYNSAHSVFS